MSRSPVRHHWMRALLTAAIAAGSALVLAQVPATLAGAVTLSVSDCSGSALDTGSLPYAVAHASAGNTIAFSPTLACNLITLTSPLTISSNVTIAGPGANLLTVSGGGTVQVFVIQLHTTVEISGLTVANGYSSTATGGGISSEGTLNLDDVTVSDNVAPDGGGVAVIGGSTAPSTATIRDSTVSGNTLDAPAGQGSGAGIYFNPFSTVALIDSTVSANNAGPGDGGGLVTGGDATLVADTITNNSGTYHGGWINGGGSVGKIGATILSDNSPANCSGSTPDSLGYNISSNGAYCGFTAPTDNTAASSLDGSLSSLANNGGPTQTVLPTVGSPSAGVIPTGTTLDGIQVCPGSDQRGYSRPGSGDGDCTIGAVEVGATLPPVATPEAPYTLVLPVLALGGLGGFILIRRRSLRAA